MPLVGHHGAGIGAGAGAGAGAGEAGIRTGNAAVDNAVEWFITRAGSGGLERRVRMRIQRLRDWLDFMFEERHVTQERVHDEYITAVLPLVFRDLWKEHREIIMRIANVDNVNQNVFVMAPRRAGKTQAVAAFLAMVLIEVPYVDVAVASRIVDQAAAVIDITKRFLGKIPWIDDVKLNWSRRTVVLCNATVPTDMRRVHALSGLNPDVRTTRAHTRTRARTHTHTRAHAHPVSVSVSVSVSQDTKSTGALLRTRWYH
jgi:hypothetical protein